MSATSAIATRPSRNFSDPWTCCPEETFRNIKEGFGLPIVEAHGKFIRPSRYGDLLEVETRIQEVRTKAIIFQFRFFPAGGDHLVAEGTAHMVAISREWRAIPIPERVLSRLTRPRPGKRVDRFGSYWYILS